MEKGKGELGVTDYVSVEQTKDAYSGENTTPVWMRSIVVQINHSGRMAGTRAIDACQQKMMYALRRERISYVEN